MGCIMIQMVISWFVLSAALWVSAQFITGFEIKEFKGALVVAAIFGGLNFALGKLLFVALGVVTLGLGFLLAFVTRAIVGAILLMITDKLSTSIRIKSFGTAVLAAVVTSLLGTAGEWLVGRIF
jgi:putative membrane protein